MTSYVWFSDAATSICQWVIYSLLCQFIDVFGIGTNIINIICFIKQGFKDSVNISLFGLALADLGCLTTMVWTNVCFTPAFNTLDLPFDALEFQYLTSGLTHTTFTRVSGWITAIITLERCLCITSPLKVRSIITPGRVSILNAFIFVLLMSSVAPVYVVNKLGYKFYPQKNKTLIGLVYRGDREKFEKISFVINNVLVPFGAFFVITICTTVLVNKLRQITKWRKNSTTSTRADGVSIRNQKVAKMVVMISALFIACFIPAIFIFVAVVVEPEFSVDGKYINILIVCFGCGFVLESVNSSVNIFIYYHMNSKYRHILLQMFGFPSNKSNRLDDS